MSLLRELLGAAPAPRSAPMPRIHRRARVHPRPPRRTDRPTVPHFGAPRGRTVRGAR